VPSTSTSTTTHSTNTTISTYATYATLTTSVSISATTATTTVATDATITTASSFRKRYTVFRQQPTSTFGKSTQRNTQLWNILFELFRFLNFVRNKRHG
jgi:hypothetical protein